MLTSNALPAKYATILCIAIVLWQAIVPVEVRWTSPDVVLTWSTTAIFVVATLSCLMPKRLAGQKVSCKGWGWVDAMVVIWILYYILRTWIGAEYPCATAFLKTMEMAMLYFALRCLMAKGRMSDKWIMGGLMVCAVYETGLGINQVINGFSRHCLYLLTGTFQNPGPYSAFLMLGTVIGLAWMQETVGKWQWRIVAAATVLTAMLLPATWSRAALLSLGVVAMGMYRQHYWRWRWLVWTGSLILCGVLYLMKQESADGRVLIWAAALTSWLHHPWTGVGIGGFLNAVGSGISEIYCYSPSSPLFAAGGVTEYAFCDLLKVFTEQGLIGACLALSIVSYTMILLWRHSKPLFYGMVSLLIFSLFSYPFELLPNRIVTVTITAWSASSQCRHAEKRVQRWWLAVPLLLIAPSVLTAKEIGRRYEADREYRTFAGMENEVFITDYYRLLALKRDDVHFLFDFGRTLRIHGRYNDSNDMLRQGTRISADPMFHVLMGNNYKDMGCPDLAELSYKKAFSVMPNRIYPLYKLMILYREDDKSDKAREYAERIISFREKISSPATGQIREEAKRYRNEHEKLHDED